MTLELDVRLAVTEEKIRNIEEDIAESKDMLNKIFGKVDSVKERFDKMNGTLPHIEKTLEDIELHLEKVSSRLANHEAKIAKTTLTTKIIWAVLLPVSLAIIGAVIKLLFS